MAKLEHWRVVRVAVVSGLLVLASCDSAPHFPAPAIWSAPGSLAPGTGGQIVDALSAQVQDAGAFETYAAEFDASYDKVFGAVVRTLNAGGDDVVQADSDKGFILTRQAAHFDGIATYIDQYIVAFEPISPSRTRMIFKMCQWSHFYANENDVLPSGVVPVPDSSRRGARAGQFAANILHAAN